MADLYKYGVAVHLYKPIIKRAVVDFAVGADWTPAAGDVKISKDGGAAANVTNLPSAITMGNTAMWDYSITATEMQAAKVRIMVSDSATKAVEDTMFEIDTYGNASAQHAIDLADAVRAGLTALPNAAAEAAGGLYTRGSGAGQINQPANGSVDTNSKTWNGLTTVALPLVPATAGRTLVVDAAGLADANVVKLGPTGAGTAQTARDIGASVLLSAGAGTGQLDFTAGVVKANLAQILATALTETAGQLAGGFKKFFNIGAPASTMDVLARVTLTDTVTTYTGNTPQTGDAYARLGAPAGASVSADVAAVKVDTAAVKVQTDKLAFTVANQIDANVIDWKGSAAPAMTGDAFARLGAPAGASVSADIAAIQAKTTNLPASPAAVGSAMTLTSGERTSVADALLDRDMSVGTDSGSPTVRTVRQALRFLRNKWGISAGTLTVTKENDLTTSWTGGVSTSAGNPVSQIDPA